MVPVPRLHVRWRRCSTIQEAKDRCAVSEKKTTLTHSFDLLTRLSLLWNFALSGFIFSFSRSRIILRALGIFMLSDIAYVDDRTVSEYYFCFLYSCCTFIQHYYCDSNCAFQNNLWIQGSFNSLNCILVSWEEESMTRQKTQLMFGGLRLFGVQKNPDQESSPNYINFMLVNVRNSHPQSGSFKA
jgi:hypothetical protein